MLQHAAEPSTDILPPPGGKLERIDVPALYSTSWDEGLLQGAPDTKPDSLVWSAGRHFPIRCEDALPSRLILMWAGDRSRMSANSAKAWGRLYELRETHPLEVFALSAAYPCFFARFGLRGAGLVPTQTPIMNGTPHLCGVWQSESTARWASLIATNKTLFDRTIFVFGEP